MFSWIGSLFSSSSTTNTIVDASISALDKMAYTDEEKADMKLKVGDMHLKYLAAYQPFKIAQRALALIFAIPFVAAFVTACILAIFGKTYKPIIAVVVEFNIHYIVGVIVAFYFAGGTLESFKRSK